MVTVLQALVTDFKDFEKYVLQALFSSVKANQHNQRDTKHLYNIMNDLQNVIKSKEHIINPLIRSDMKTSQDHLIVDESNTWKS